MEDEYIHVKRILDQKLIDIKNFIYKIEDLETINKDIMIKLADITTTKENLEYDYKSQIKALEEKYSFKENEYSQLKINSEEKLSDNIKSNQDEQVKLVKEYEDKLEIINKNHKEAKDKLTNFLRERENDYKSLEDKSNEKEKKFEETIKELRREISILKHENGSLRNKNNIIFNEIDSHITGIEKDEKNKTAEIQKEKKMFETSKKNIEENKDLKETTEKLYDKFKIKKGGRGRSNRKNHNNEEAENENLNSNRSKDNYNGTLNTLNSESKEKLYGTMNANMNTKKSGMNTTSGLAATVKSIKSTISAKTDNKTNKTAKTGKTGNKSKNPSRKLVK